MLVNDVDWMGKNMVVRTGKVEIEVVHVCGVVVVVDVCVLSGMVGWSGQGVGGKSAETRLYA